jgi:hypothetical protein
MDTNVSTENQTAKRYVVTVSYYLYAEDDKAAIREANFHTLKLNQKEDCRASVDGIVESEFGKIGSRKVM